MVRSLKLAAGVLALTALLLTGCRETINVGTVALPTWDAVSAFTFNVTVPGNARSGSSFGHTLTITGGTAPFEVTYSFDTGVTPRTHTRNISGRQDVLTVTYDEVDQDTPVTLTVTVRDGANRTVSRERTFTLRPASDPADAPEIVLVNFSEADCSLTVDVAYGGDGEVTVHVELDASATVSVDATSKTVGSNNRATFFFAADDIVGGGTGTATIRASADGQDSPTQTQAINCPGVDLEDNFLYAIATRTTVGVGEELRVVVATGQPAFPFYFMNGVRVIFPEASGGEYVRNSFNVGSIGGARGDVDGIWTAVDPDDFLLGPDSFIVERDANGFTALDFNVTPLPGGNEITVANNPAVGALFNFAVTFDTPGEYRITFQEADNLTRTYYTDSSEAPDRLWGGFFPADITVE